MRRVMVTLRIAALLVLLILAGAWGAAWWRQGPGEGLGESLVRLVGSAPPPSAGGIVLPAGTQVGGPFRLRDHAGRAVSEADYAGGPAVVFFGFTHCPDVCPTELQTVAAALDLLGPEAGRVSPLFVSVDPERDTPERLAEYVALFHPRIVGLTGTPEEVAAAARAFRVYYARVHPPEASTYTMDHSAFTYLMDGRFRLRALFRPGASAEELAAGIRAALAG